MLQRSMAPARGAGRAARGAGRPPPGHPEVDSQHCIAATGPGRLNETEPLCQQHLEASCATLGDRHLDNLASIVNMVRLCHEQGTLDDAESLLREAVEQMSKLLHVGRRGREVSV